jgi:hypothetical protein
MKLDVAYLKGLIFVAHFAFVGVVAGVVHLTKVAA